MAMTNTSPTSNNTPRRRSMELGVIAALIASFVGVACGALDSDRASSKFDTVGQSIDAAGGGGGGGGGYDDLDASEPYSPETPQAPADTTPATTTAPVPPEVGPTASTTTGPTGSIASTVWTDPATDGQSTFGLDVDTGSYSSGRRWIEDRMPPEPDSVRVEEYVNAVVEAPAFSGDDALDLEVGGATSPFAPEEAPTQLLRVSIGSAPLSAEDRPDVDLTLVVDVSGSMDGPPLTLVKSSLVTLTRQLRPTDTVAIVTYGDTAEVVLPATAMADTLTVLEAIEDLRIEGSTNAEAGLALGYHTARATQAASATDRVNRVVLASDGVANVGVTDPDGLAAQLRDDADAGIKLITLGFGMGEYNDPLMEQLADQGDGFYAYVDDDDEAQRLFVDELTASLITVAEEARAQVSFNHEAVAGYRLLGYENRAIADEDFRNDAVDAGEIGAGHSVVALYEVRLRPDAQPDQRVATVDLRWLTPGSSEAATEIGGDIEVADLTTPWTAADPTTRAAAVVAAWAEVLGQRPILAERNLTLAQVDVVADELRAELAADAAFQEFADLVRVSTSL